MSLRRFNLSKIFINIAILMVLSFLLMPNMALAKPMPGCVIPTERDDYKPIIINFALPNITAEIVNPTTGNTQYVVKDLPCFIIGIYVYFAGVVGILATVMIMYGGVKYLISMGSPQRMSDAKDTIFSAVVGLVLVLGAYMLLNLINPNLTELQVKGITPVLPISEVPECVENNSEPKIAGKISCGDWGYITNSKNSDERSDAEKSSDEADARYDCHYTDCSTQEGDYCMPGTKEDPMDQIFSCQNPSVSCNLVTDENAFTQSQLACDPYSVPEVGLCEWLDYSFLDITSKDDKCVWFPRINCYNDSWEHTSCEECKGKYEPYYIAPHWLSVIFPSAGKPGILTVCLPPGEKAYEHNPLNTEAYMGICCKKVREPSSEYPLGSVYFSQERWNVDVTGGF